MKAYALTMHASKRIEQRGISPEQMASALAGRQVALASGLTMCYDRQSHTGCIVNHDTAQIITVVRLKKKEIKQLYSR
jgi:hypothetical protein